MSFLIARVSSGVWLNPHHCCPLAECLCCRSVTERQRRWTLHSLVEFWLAVIIRASRAVSQAPSTSGGRLCAAARRRQGCVRPSTGSTPRGCPRGHFAGQVVPEAGGGLPLPRPFPGGGSWQPSVLTAGGGCARPVQLRRLPHRRAGRDSRRTEDRSANK